LPYFASRTVSGRRVLRRYRDGSYLALVGGLQLRVIECEITISTTAGTHTGIYRLGTTLLDYQRFPAFAVVKLYHERWDVESTYMEIKSTLLGRRVLRSAHPALIAQEIYALLAVYQVLRIAITDAAESTDGVDPDRGQLHHRGPDRPGSDRASRERHRRNHH